MSSKLTLNIGLRWDIYPSVREAHNIFTFLNPNGTNSITGNKGTLEFAGNGDPAIYLQLHPAFVHLVQEHRTAYRHGLLDRFRRLSSVAATT